MKVVPAAGLVVVLLGWVMLICAATATATTTSSEITGLKSPAPPPPRAQTLELDLKDVNADKYSQVIAALRLALKDPVKSCFGIPMLRKLSQPEYIYIKFTSAEGRNSIVVAINKADIYVQGYTYKSNQARCFKDVYDKKQCNVIFPEAQNPEKEQNIGYEGSYIELQRKAGVGTQSADRMEIELGMTALGSFIDKVSKTNPSSIPKDEAKFLLNAIQMFAEAARFKYIQAKVKKSIPDNFYPGYLFIGLENGWGKLSTAIQSVTSDIQIFEHPVTIWNEAGGNWIITYVKQIQGCMGLLNAAEDPKLVKCTSNVLAVSAQ